MPSAKILSALGCAGVLYAGIASAAVIVVEPMTQPGNPLLQAALAAAADGDIVLVRAGNYGTDPLQVQGKGITVIRDWVFPVTIPRLEIFGVPAGSAFVLRGFRLQSNNSFFGQPTLSVTDCEGSVWVEDCEVRGMDGFDSFGPVFPTAALVVSSSQAVVASRCRFLGGNGFSTSFMSAPIDGAPGCRAEQGSHVVLHHAEALGGVQGSGVGIPFFGEANGVRVADSSATVFGCDIRAGSYSGDSGTGYAGILVSGGGTVHLRDTSVLAGAAPASQAAEAPPIDAPPGAVIAFSTPAMSLAIDAPAEAGDVVKVQVTGPPGTPCGLFLGAFGPAPVIVQYENAFLLSGPLAGPFFLGTIGPAGSLDLSIPTAPLPAATPDGVVVSAQAFAAGALTTLEGASVYVQVKPGL